MCKNLTVYYSSRFGNGYHREYTQVPRIEIQGQWLERLGFRIGDRITVTEENGKLVIEKEGGRN